jgi:hypothetical protein
MLKRREYWRGGQLSKPQNAGCSKRQATGLTGEVLRGTKERRLSRNFIKESQCDNTSAKAVYAAIDQKLEDLPVIRQIRNDAHQLAYRLRSILSQQQL